MEAFVHSSSARPDGTRDSFLTMRVEYRHAPMPHHRAGLTWTASGYGDRIPTEHMIKYLGRWRRVYCRIYSNCGTLYLGKRISEGLIVSLHEA